MPECIQKNNEHGSIIQIRICQKQTQKHRKTVCVAWLAYPLNTVRCRPCFAISDDDMLHAHELCRGGQLHKCVSKKNWHLQAASQYLLSLGHAQNIVSWRRFLMSWPHISRCLSGNRVPLVHSLMIMFRKKHGHTWGSITNCQTNRNFFPKDNLPQARATLLSQMHQITVLEVAETKSGCSAFPTWAAGVCITPMGWAYNILLKSS